MNNIFTHKQLLAALLYVSCSIPAVTTATVNKVEDNSVTVSFADLDLSKQIGMETLYHRLQSAARRACGGTQDIRNIRMHQLHNQCYTEALTRAVQSFDNEQLTAIHVR